MSYRKSSVSGGRFKRRALVRFSVAVAGLLTLAGCSAGAGGASGAVDDELDIAWAASPASIVPSENTTMATRDIGLNIYEGLVAYDADYQMQPMLAESWEAAPDGKSVAFTLRSGVLFHDGTEMTPEDVVASIEYWSTRNVSAIQYLSTLKTSIDGNTLTLSTDTAEPILDLLAVTVQPLAIMPASVLEGVGEGEAVTEYIGTGPYSFAEWQKDQYVSLTRFDDYVGLDTPSSGYAGAKAASIENLKFWIVTDPSARVAGLQSGTYDAIDQVQSDELSQLSGDDYATNIAMGTFSLLFFNHSEGPMADEYLRKALYQAIDMEQVEQATFSDPSQYELDGAVAPKGNAFYTQDGLDGWNAGDLDAAKELLAKSSYSGDTIRILATEDYPQIYNFAIVVQETLKSLGIESDITTQPWTTYLETRSEPGNWDLSFTTLYPLATLPSTFSFLASTYPGWIDSAEITAAIEQVNSAQSDEEKTAAAAALQAANSDYVGFLKSGNEATITAAESSLTGLDYLAGPIYWNAAFSE